LRVARLRYRPLSSPSHKHKGWLGRCCWWGRRCRALWPSFRLRLRLHQSPHEAPPIPSQSPDSFETNFAGLRRRRTAPYSIALFIFPFGMCQDYGRAKMHQNATYINDILLIHHPPMTHLTTPTPRVGKEAERKRVRRVGLEG
jgi:hypothetical protein